ncbi:MAG TPA: cation transporter [Prolixibacteraceae bacterium]|nr:cation transporter [Prolixibacteraceae bacterium]
MKHLVALLALVLLTGVGFHSAAQKKAEKTVCYKSNMHCADCEKTLFEYLRFEKGVKDLKVDHVSNTVKVVYAEGKTSEESLVKAIGKKGYQAEKISVEEYRKLIDNAGKTTPQKTEQHQH